MLGDLAWRGFGFAYGMFNFALMAAIAAFRDKAFTDRPTDEDKRELALGMLILYCDKRKPS
jgi:hypothetical protein